MIKKTFLLLLIMLCTTSYAVYAQDDGGPDAKTQTMIKSIRDEFNVKVNADISDGTLYQHRVTLNSSGGQAKVWGQLSKYEDNITCYFDIINDEIVLRKVIVFTNIASRRSYADYLFDSKGDPVMCMYHHDTNSPTVKPSRYFYAGKKALSVEEGDLVVYANEFSTENLSTSTKMLQKAIYYANLFDAMIKVQVEPAK